MAAAVQEPEVGRIVKPLFPVVEPRQFVEDSAAAHEPAMVASRQAPILPPRRTVNPMFAVVTSAQHAPAEQLFGGAKFVRLTVDPDEVARLYAGPACTPEQVQVACQAISAINLKNDDLGFIADIGLDAQKRIALAATETADLGTMLSKLMDVHRNGGQAEAALADLRSRAARIVGEKFSALQIARGMLNRDLTVLRYLTAKLEAIAERAAMLARVERRLETLQVSQVLSGQLHQQMLNLQGEVGQLEDVDQRQRLLQQPAQQLNQSLTSLRAGQPESFLQSLRKLIGT